MTSSKFKTKSGRLTSYALACGYIEEKYYGQTRITLEMPCPGNYTFHVRAHDHAAHERRFWEVFETLTEARRHYDHAEALIVAGHES